MRQIFFALAFLSGCSSAEVREFEGSYPKDERPTGTIREFSLVAAPTEIPLLDGKPLKVWAYNGRVPGPILRVRLGQTVRATLENHLPQATTIHWHGVRLQNAMDGVPGVTQPAVEPGGRFTYEFTPKDAGTFWFHPHLSASEQVERGLYGVLIVEDVTPLPYSRDEVWVLDDTLLTPTGEISPEFNTRHDLMHDGRWGNVLSVNGDRQLRFSVRPGERIRLRLINVANGRIFRPDLSELKPEVIAFDGLYAARPFAFDQEELAPGNRVDLDLTIPKEARGRSFEIVDRFLPRPNHLAEIVVADEEPMVTAVFVSPAKAHIPSWPRAHKLPTTAEYRLNARSGGVFGIEWTLNDQVFAHAAHQHDASAHQSLPLGKFSKLKFVNESFRLHPMHLHGSFFKLLSRNGQPVDEPHFRDTVLVHAKETVEVGLVPLDPGRWMMHCHILEHAESGMMTLIEVR